MERAVDSLRDALEAFRHDEAIERVRRFRRTDDAESERQVARRHRHVGRKGRVRALLDEVDGDGAVLPEERAALRAHFARAAADLSLAETRDALELVSVQTLKVGRSTLSIEGAADALDPADSELRRFAERALIDHADAVGHALVGARNDANEAGLAIFVGGERPPDAGPEGKELVESAARFLAATDDLNHEVVSFLVQERRAFADLLVALRFPEASAMVGRRDRHRRIVEGVEGLGFGRDFGARVRLGGAHPFPTPRARLCLLRLPGDVRIFESKVERGVLSELAARDALGRALGHVLVAPGLPVEHKRPLAGSVARSFGMLFVQLAADRVLLRGGRGLGEGDADRLARAAGAALVLWSRARAAALVARADAHGAERQAESGSTALERALGVPVPLAYARLAVVTPAAIGPRFRSTIAGLALAWQLRERFDEDWFRNDKAAEPLRAGAARGNLLSAEALLDEVGATDPVDLAVKRVTELFG